MENVKRTYSKPRICKIDYTYEERVTAESDSFVGRIGSKYEHLNLCQMGVNEAGFSTCTYYFYTPGAECQTDQMPMMLPRP